VTFECPFCTATLVLTPGSFPFLRTQLIVHLDACKARPADTGTEPITDLADALAKRICG
jgi:hypothetical protein